ncbi:hypothetical protein AWB65_06499 [Caballeronia humi]|uniref:Uncharacterized protein n=1 Tax=Caballeronia humi TaxID=326474 RepID=A0A158JES1_9BURK|nr:hypothetical protein AWB65_06499 [Caballeronia humi]
MTLIVALVRAGMVVIRCKAKPLESFAAHLTQYHGAVASA